MFIQGEEVQEGGGQGSLHPLAQPLTPQAWCPCLAPHHLLRAPHSQAWISLGGENRNNFPHGSGGHSHSPSPMPVTLPMCWGSSFLMDVLSALEFISIFL